MEEYTPMDDTFCTVSFLTTLKELRYPFDDHHIGMEIENDGHVVIVVSLSVVNFSVVEICRYYGIAVDKMLTRGFYLHLKETKAHLR